MKILGLTDSVHTCDCCGKPNLKQTVGIELDSGEIVYYGTTCATKKHTGKKLGELKKEAENNMAAYVSEMKEKAITFSEYETMKKTIAIAKHKGLKFKAFADHNRASILAFDDAVDRLIAGNPYGVKYLVVC